MKKVFDLMDAIEAGVQRYYAETSRTPTSVSVSPGFYRQLLEILSQSDEFGNLLIGHTALVEHTTGLGKVKIEIDELLDDISIIVS